MNAASDDTKVSSLRPRVPLGVMARRASALSLVGVSVNILLQLAYAPVLLRYWGDSGFGFVVAVQGFASYVSVADAGVQIYFVQRIAALRSSGEHAEADALTVSCFRLLRALALVGGSVVFIAFAATGHAIWVGLARDSGTNATLGLGAALSQIVAGATSLVLGGWSTAVDYGRNRHVRVQVVGLLKVVLSAVSLLALAVFGLRAPLALLLSGLASLALDAGRFAITRVGEPRPTNRDAVALWALLHEARGSALLYVASSTQNGLQPYVTAVLSPSALAVAVPAKTLANGARSVSSAIGTAVWVAMASRLAELPSGKARYAFWARNAPILSVVQLGCLAALMGIAPLFVPHWIPAKGGAVLAVLPWFCAEQAICVATIPAQFLLFATGKFGRVGVAMLAAALFAVGATWLSVPRYGPAGFAAAAAAGAILVLGPLLGWAEWSHWRNSGVRYPWAVPVRFGVALAAVGLCAAYARSPVAAAVAMLGLAGTVFADNVRLRRSTVTGG